MSCSYNCSAPPPPLSPDNDITGVGVIINYTVTAGIALLVIFIHYVVVYDPSHDPFQVADDSDPPFRPNPVDEMFLRGLRCWPTYIWSRIMGPRRMSPHFSARLERTSIKCILAVSDLQIVTGFAILVSGFVELRCGLAAYHWYFILNLAWFSCLTHLACLTLLRNYLYTRTLERLWRLLAMGALTTLLVVGLLSTGNPFWGDGVISLNGDNGGNLPHTGAPAICYLGISDRHVGLLGLTFWTTLVSALLIGLGFVSRVVKLHRSLSVAIFGQARLWLSIRARQLLRIVFEWSYEGSSRHSLRHSLCYRPLFALFLAARFLLDGWASVAFEVGWLIVAFTWGMLRLAFVLYGVEDGFGSNPGNWTFGQLVSVLLLAAPLITMVGYFDHDAKHEEQATSNGDTDQSAFSSNSQMTHDTTALSTEELDGSEDPDNDWSHHARTLGTAVAYAFLVSLVVAISIFDKMLSNWSSTLSPLVGVALSYYCIPLAFSGLYGVILFSLMIGVALPWSRWLRVSLQSVAMVFFVISASTIPDSEHYLQGIAAGFYILCALAFSILGRRPGGLGSLFFAISTFTKRKARES